MSPTEHATLKATILDLTRSGIKGVDLACEVAVRHREVGDSLPQVLDGLVARGELVEVEFVTPDNRQGETARVKSFYLPAGTDVRVCRSATPEV